MKKITKWDIISIVFILANFIIGINLAPRLPERVPTHWNINGMIDGYGDKAFIIWHMPLIIAGIYLLMVITPYIDPRKQNYTNFLGEYGIIKLFVSAFLSIILWLSAAAALGVAIDMKLIMPILVGMLFIVLGAIMPKVKQNYFVGFKTPWAIENEEVWEKTQKSGSFAFIIGGFLSIVLAFTPFAWIFFIIILLMVLYPFIYSYFIYQKVKNK